MLFVKISFVFINLVLVAICAPVNIKFIPIDFVSEQNQMGHIRIEALFGVPVEKVIEKLKHFGHLAMSEARIKDIYEDVIRQVTPTEITCPSTSNIPSSSDDEELSEGNICLEHEVDLIFMGMIDSYMDERRDWSISELADEMKLPENRIIKLLDKSQYQFVEAEWVPKMLTRQDRNKRIDSSKTNIEKHASNTNFYDNIVSLDEFWLRSYEPSDEKLQLWKRSCESPPKRTKIAIGDYKLMVSVAVRQGRIIYYKVFGHKQNVNSDRVIEVLQKTKEWLTANANELNTEYRGIPYILMDNASPHTSDKTVKYLPNNFELVEMPPYSPDLHPCDFDTIKRLKSLMPKNQRMSPQRMIAEFKNAVEIVNANPLDNKNELLNRWKFVVANDGSYNPGAQTQK